MMLAALILAAALQVQAADALTLPPEEEARAQALMRETRCMVCAGESIMDSNAPMALDMRRFVRERVASGETDAEVQQALVDRFGHEVLLDPGFSGRTAILWLTPLLLLGFGGALLAASMRNKRSRAG
ncbi:MAG: cytochrome c-type biogenesis protein CcmH [Alphaproteobacteria bacterium]|nr:cytochrome c-type biogenesis protein CcmH [Alphaproteobacteria bacterium]